MRIRLLPGLIAVLLVLSSLAGSSGRAVGEGDVEQRIADFWKRIELLGPGAFVSAADLGQWALNVTERNPRARMTVAEFRISAQGMQTGMDRAGLALAAPTPTSVPIGNVEQRIADFWKRIDALSLADYLAAGDLGLWALNVIERNPRARMTVGDFRVSTAGMQVGMDSVGLAPVAPTPSPTPTSVPNPTPSPAPSPAGSTPLPTPTGATPAPVQDTTPPALRSLAISPATVDTSLAAQAITVTARLTDDLSGFGANRLAGFVRFTSPSGQIIDATFYYPSQVVSGSARDATFSYTMTLPQFSEHGTWTGTWLNLTDLAGNSLNWNASQIAAAGFTASFVQQGAGTDTTPPALRSLAISPATVDTSLAAQAITVTARLTDDLSGFGANRLAGFVRFTSPSGQIIDATFYYPSQVVSGSARDATFSYTMTLPQFSEHGTWTGTWLNLTDLAGNSLNWNASQIGAAGFTAVFRNGP